MGVEKKKAIFDYYISNSHSDRQKHLSFMVTTVSNFILIHFRHTFLPFVWWYFQIFYNYGGSLGF